MFQLKKKTKLVCSLLVLHPRAKFNVFMQLSMVQETELQLYLHITHYLYIIARRVLSLKTVRADIVCRMMEGSSLFL